MRLAAFCKMALYLYGTMAHNIVYKTADTAADYELARGLFREYAASLGVDLSFQDFEHELANVHEQYHPPYGALLLAFAGDTAIGCTGIRRLADGVAELKRMYVQPAYRGSGRGLQLLQRAIALATDAGYHTLRLDTLPDMAQAQQLYRTFGFKEIPPYRYNPVAGTMYMEKDLNLD